MVFNAIRSAMSRAGRRKNDQNHCFVFNVLGHNLAQMACPDFARGLVILISCAESDFDSPEARPLHTKSGFAFSSCSIWIDLGQLGFI